MAIHIPEKEIQVLTQDSLRVARIENFLDQSDRDRLFRTLCENQKEYKSPNLQKQTTSKLVTIGDNGMFESKSEAVLLETSLFRYKIIENLPLICQKLNTDNVSTSNIRISLLHGIGGHYTDLHQDVTDNNMKVTVLYYLRNESKSFTGGNLQLFSSKTTDGCREDHSEGNFIDIAPEDNSLVVFRSDTFHHVTEIVSNSQKFEDGRFAVTAFI